MISVLPLISGIVWGYILKHAINWLNIDDFQLSVSNPVLEIICSFLFLWSFSELVTPDAIIFSLISSTLCAIAIVDLFTMQIPLLFIFQGSNQSQPRNEELVELVEDSRRQLG